MGAFIILLAVILTALFLLGAKALAQTRKFFVEPKEGEIIAIMRGESFSHFIITVDGKDIDEKHNVIKGTRRKGFLEKLIGVKWIGLYPWKTVYEFKVNADKLKEGEELKQKPKTLDDLIAHEKKRDVHALLYKIPRPVLIEDVELPGDNSQIAMLFRAIITVTNPYQFLFVHKANIALVGEAIQAAVIGYCQKALLDGSVTKEKMTYKGWLSHEKGKESEFIKSIKEINFGTKTAPLGIEVQYGLHLEEIYLIEFEADETTQKIADALRKKEEEQALLEAAGPEAERKKKLAAVDPLVVMVGNLKELIGAQNASAIAMSAAQRDGLEKYRGQFLSIGGAGPAITVPFSVEKKKASPEDKGDDTKKE